MRVVFLGFSLPEEAARVVIAADAYMPAQTHRFGWSVVSALTSAGAEVSVIGAAPAVDYPHNPQIIFRGFRFLESGVEGRAIGFVNISPLKHVTRYVGARRALAEAARKSGADAVLVHGLNSALIWAALKGSPRLGARTVVILTDPPTQRLETDSGVRWLMKRLDRHAIMSGLRRIDGAIALSEPLATSLVPDLPHLVMEGIASTAPIVKHSRQRSSGLPEVVYAGTLNDTYGVLELMDAVELSDGGWHLSIFGQGPLEPVVRHRADGNRRLTFGGLLSADQLSQVYAEADLLVNPRGTTEEFVRYSFPSWNISALALLS